MWKQARFRDDPNPRLRTSTRWIVWHRAGGRLPDGTEIPLSWEATRDALTTAWDAQGTPEPYVLAVEPARVVQIRDLEARTSHAGWVAGVPSPNAHGLAVAILGHWVYQTPSDQHLRTLVELSLYLAEQYPAAEFVTHDEIRQLQGLPPKGCPGHRFPAQDVRTAIVAGRKARGI